MKKALFLAALAVSASSFAQKSTPGGSLYIPSSENYMMVVPKEFAYNGKPLLTVVDRESDSQVSVYDENIELVKTFEIDQSKTFDYSKTYQTEKREVTAVTEIVNNKTDMGCSFDEWLTREAALGADADALIITQKENGDSVITVDYDKSGYALNKQMYFGYSLLGMKYPRQYWLASQGKLYQYKSSYTATYSDWVATGQNVVPESVTLPYIDLYNLNLDNGAGTNVSNGTYFLVSQTLFNDDEDYEYIIPKLAMVSKTSDGSASPGDIVIDTSVSDGLEATTRTTLVAEKSTVAMVGFKVVSSAGNVLCDLDFDDDFSISYESYKRYALVTIGGNRYLTFSSNDGTVFYKIDAQASSIKKVKATAGSLFVQPTVVNGNATINVSLGDDNSDGSDIVVTSMSGSKVTSASVPPTQSQAQLSVSAPSGVYCVSRVQQGKASETKKIVVK